MMYLLIFIVLSLAASASGSGDHADPIPNGSDDHAGDLPNGSDENADLADDGDDHEGHHHSICNKMVDLGFIIDSSGSIQYHFKRELELVDMVHKEVSGHIMQLRAGIMSFSDRVILYHRLKHYRKNMFNFFLYRMVWQGKITRLDLAFEYALKEFFLVTNGHRPGAIRVIIMFTDGRQTIKGVPGGVRDPSKIVEHLRHDGVHVFLVGIVDVDTAALKKIDNGMNQLIFAGTLQQDIEDIAEIVPHQCKSAICRIEAVPREPDCEQFVDIVFVVDSSGSLRGYFDAEKYFVNTVAEQFDISKRNSRVAFVRFSDIVKTEIHLADYTDLHAFHEAVGEIEYDGGLTRIDLGLINAKAEFTHPNSEARRKNSQIKKILMLLTDGRQLDTDPNPAIVAKEIRDMGVEIIVLGVGYEIDDDQMQEIAGPGIKWYKHDTFDELINIHNIERIQGVTCHGHEHEHEDHDGRRR